MKTGVTGTLLAISETRTFAEYVNCCHLLDIECKNYYLLDMVHSIQVNIMT